MITTRRFAIRLIAGVFIVNLLLYAVVGLSLYQRRQQVIKQTEFSTQNLAHSLESSIAGTFAKIDVGMVALVEESQRQLAGGGINGKALNDFTARLATHYPELEGIRIADADGNVRYGTLSKAPNYLQFFGRRGRPRPCLPDMPAFDLRIITSDSRTRSACRAPGNVALLHLDPPDWPAPSPSSQGWLQRTDAWS